MKKGKIAKALVHTLIATVYTVPYSAYAMGEKKAEPPAGAKSEEATQAIKREVIQLLKEEEKPDTYRFNIAGQPGVHFKMYYSPSGEEGTYQPLTGGEGVIGENGMANIDINLADAGEDEVSLKVFTSDTADFSGEVRVTPEPMVVALGEGVLGLRWRFPSRRGTVRTPTAVAAVRGRLPEEGPFKKPVIPK
jgi:hypothetical protein